MSKHLKRGAANHLLRQSLGHLVNACDEEEEITCDIACTTLASAYTVQGVDALVGCEACADSALAAWDGVLEQVEDSCQWNLNSIVSIAGKQASYSLDVGSVCSEEGTSNGVGIWYHRDLCRWELAITCRTADGLYNVIWAGTKEVERGPAGVYTRVCGCDETPAFTVT